MGGAVIMITFKMEGWGEGHLLAFLSKQKLTIPRTKITKEAKEKRRVNTFGPFQLVLQRQKNVRNATFCQKK